jgi:hypothetical protein
VVKRSPHIIRWLERALHLKARAVISVLIACICNLSNGSVPLSEAGKLRAEPDPVNSPNAGKAKNANRRKLIHQANSEAHHVRLARKFSRTQFDCFRSDTRARFLSQAKFFHGIKNKIHFFLVAFATDF